jgi:serine/threonine protein kinase
MQDLTRPVRFSYHSPDHYAKNYIAGTLAALRNAIASLRIYYRTEQHHKTVMNDQPCWDTCRDIQESTSHTIMYENKPRPSVFKRVWFGCTDDGERICIKFTHFYSTKAHQFMARKGWAPHLLGFQTVPPKWCMVVMKDLRDGYEHLTLSAQNEHKDNWRTLWEAIRQALQALHDAKLVHGDIRRANVMVKPDLSDFKLIGFDCAGEIGKALYPPRYSIDPRIGRLEGTWDGKPIKADHDKLMLQKLSD